MNCCYHPDYPAVTQCSCGKGLCNYCSNLIDPNMCLDCSKAKIINSIIKAVVTLLFSIIVAVLAVVSYNLVIKGTITNEYVRLIFILPMDFSSGFLDELLKFLFMHDITFSATAIDSFKVFFMVYWIASVPWGIYVLSVLKSKISETSTEVLSTDLIGGLITLVFKIWFIGIKFVIAILIGPIIMPIAVIVSVVRVIRNIIKLIRCSKLEKSVYPDLT